MAGYEKTEAAVQVEKDAQQQREEAAKAYQEALKKEAEAEWAAAGTAVKETTENAVETTVAAGTAVAYGVGKSMLNIADGVNKTIDKAKEAIDNTGEAIENTVTNAKNDFYAKVEDFATDVANDARQRQGKTLENTGSAIPAENITAEAYNQTNTGKKLPETNNHQDTAAAKKEISKEAYLRGDDLVANMPENERQRVLENRKEAEAANEQKFMDGYDLTADMPEIERQRVLDGRRAGEHENTTTTEKAEQERLDGLFKKALNGELGNGEDRKEALGPDYPVIQDRINNYYAQKANAELGIDDITKTAEVSLEAGA